MNSLYLNQSTRNSQVWQYFALAYIGALIFFPNASWGLLDMHTNTDNFYYRGSGQLILPLITWYLLSLSAATWLLSGRGLPRIVHHNLITHSKIFWIIFILNIPIGVLFFDLDIIDIIGEKGLQNIINMMLLFFVVGVLFSSKTSLRLLINFIIACGLIRGLWGVFRFTFLGGDPANFYANFQQIDVQLTFFDINDSLIAVIILSVATWRLLTKDYSKAIEKYFYTGLCFLEVFIIMFSFRRTAWGGLALVILLFAFKHSNRVYRQILIALFFVALLAFGLLGTQRVENTYEGDLGIMQIFSDVLEGDSVSLSTGRFAELYAAYLSFVESPIFGLGLWGEYDGHLFPDLYWHGGDFTWMHSGLAHIALKSGLIGLGVSMWAMYAFFQFFKQSFSTLQAREASISIAGFGGFLFLLPNWILGTPVIEYRTMQLMALTIVLPYLAHAVNNAPKRE